MRLDLIGNGNILRYYKLIIINYYSCMTQLYKRTHQKGSKASLPLFKCFI